MEHEARQARDKCGAVGVVSSRAAAPIIYEALRALQHRGQESAGIATWDGQQLETIKAMGLVETIFSQRELESLRGRVGIGHVRYSTTGGSRIENAHPVCVTSLAGGLALGHNGDIVNSAALRAELQQKGWSFITTNDSEVAVRLFANELSHDAKDPAGAMRRTMERLVGAYSMVLVVGDAVMGVRDPHGIKPLVLGELPQGGFIVASETCALETVGARFLRDVEPGEIVLLQATAVGSHPMPGPRPAPAHCMFEYVYFARADSVLDGREAYSVRLRLGELLAKESPVEADVVIPVPDSGRTHAAGYARASGIPLAEGLMKNRYVHRTFIMPEPELRKVGVRRKLAAVRSVVEGARVVLVDDSIVRGTTMARIVQLLREAGAREVHVRIGSPPIKAPCYLGIDMSTRDQLIAARLDEAQIGQTIGADSLAYLSTDSLVEAIGLGPERLCLGCLTGRYPVPIPGEKTRDGTPVPVGKGPVPLPFGAHP